MVRIFVEISKIMSERMQFKIMNPRRNKAPDGAADQSNQVEIEATKVFTLFFFSGYVYNNIIKQAYQIQERESDERSKKIYGSF